MHLRQGVPNWGTPVATPEIVVTNRKENLRHIGKVSLLGGTAPRDSGKQRFDKPLICGERPMYQPDDSLSENGHARAKFSAKMSSKFSG